MTVDKIKHDINPQERCNSSVPRFYSADPGGEERVRYWPGTGNDVSSLNAGGSVT